MTVAELSAQIDVPMGAPVANGEPAMTPIAYTAIASFDGEQWASLCPELDIASVGATADEALDRLVEAVTEAVRFARDEDMGPGRAVPDPDLLDFMTTSRYPYQVRKFYV